MSLGATSAMYMGAFIDAIPIPKPPIILNITNNDKDSGNIDGKPDPNAEIENKIAEMIKEYFLTNLGSKDLLQWLQLNTLTMRFLQPNLS